LLVSFILKRTPKCRELASEAVVAINGGEIARARQAYQLKPQDLQHFLGRGLPGSSGMHSPRNTIL